jgi:cell division protein FtsB
MVVEPVDRAAAPVRPTPVGRRVAPRRSRAWLGVLLVLVAAIGGLCLLYLEQTSRVVELGYELTRLQRNRDQVALEVAALRYELARRQSLARVEDLARREYGMVPLRKAESLRLARPAPLPTPVPPPRSERSWWQRVQDALLGVGHAEAETTP